jgi:hypothetical protein
MSAALLVCLTLIPAPIGEGRPRTVLVGADDFAVENYMKVDKLPNKTSGLKLKITFTNGKTGNHRSKVKRDKGAANPKLDTSKRDELPEASSHRILFREAATIKKPWQFGEDESQKITGSAGSFKIEHSGVITFPKGTTGEEKEFEVMLDMECVTSFLDEHADGTKVVSKTLNTFKVSVKRIKLLTMKWDGTEWVVTERAYATEALRAAPELVVTTPGANGFFAGSAAGSTEAACTVTVTLICGGSTISPFPPSTAGPNWNFTFPYYPTPGTECRLCVTSTNAVGETTTICIPVIIGYP